jgi:hypothetical protein
MGTITQQHWVCHLEGFNDADKRLIREVFEQKEGWADHGKYVKLADPRSGLASRRGFFRMIKTPESVMRVLYPEPHLRGLSVTDRGGSTILVHIHAKNWDRIPPDSDFRDLRSYRVALINHELSHVFGHDHVKCPQSGLPADVRQQPSKPLGGCEPNETVVLYDSAGV